ncbi:hypothetical protein BR93DRAFT_960755 [Coniochaeta sp. PMI_546]|nr:hypothetical protein BR93DRAFT_960755 [Coniochaeta sp. PMI_546]
MSTNVSQPAHPMLINLPKPPSNPGTPSEMPGTPTSTTTSLSALSTTAIKDGHRGHALPPHGRGHHSNPSTNSLEAERADRISRLAGLSSVSRPGGNNQSGSAQTTPTSSGFLPPHNNNNNPGLNQYLTPAYFDAHGQPVAATKMSTVGTASASATTAHDGDRDDEEMGDADATDIGDEDLQSMDTYEEGSASASGYRDTDPMEEEDPSVGGFEDRMSDDGSASLVGFGEGAGSTVSGPIYHRRPIPGGFGSSSAGAMDRHLYGLDRRDSGLSSTGGDGVGAGRRETVVGRPQQQQQQQTGLVGAGPVGGGGGDTPVSGAEREHRAALGFDGVVVDAAGELDDGWVDTSARGPVPVTSAIRETQQPGSHQQQPSAQYPGSTSREAAERIVRERLGEEKGEAAMGSPKGGELGRFYFEERK